MYNLKNRVNAIIFYTFIVLAGLSLANFLSAVVVRKPATDVEFKMG